MQNLICLLGNLPGPLVVHWTADHQVKRWSPTRSPCVQSMCHPVIHCCRESPTWCIHTRYKRSIKPSIMFSLVFLKLIEPSHKSQNASLPYPTMQHLVTEMCTCVHISATKWCIMGYLSGALWDL